jgi:hypothetical protein
MIGFILGMIYLTYKKDKFQILVCAIFYHLIQKMARTTKCVCGDNFEENKGITTILTNNNFILCHNNSGCFEKIVEQNSSHLRINIFLEKKDNIYCHFLTNDDYFIKKYKDFLNKV